MNKYLLIILLLAACHHKVKEAPETIDTASFLQGGEIPAPKEGDMLTIDDSGNVKMVHTKNKK